MDCNTSDSSVLCLYIIISQMSIRLNSWTFSHFLIKFISLEISSSFIVLYAINMLTNPNLFFQFWLVPWTSDPYIWLPTQLSTLIYNLCFTLNIFKTKPSICPQFHHNLFLLASFFVSVNSQYMFIFSQARHLGLFLDASFTHVSYILGIKKCCHLYLYYIFRFQTLFTTSTSSIKVPTSTITQLNHLFCFLNTAARVSLLKCVRWLISAQNTLLFFHFT